MHDAVRADDVDESLASAEPLGHPTLLVRRHVGGDPELVVALWRWMIRVFRLLRFAPGSCVGGSAHNREPDVQAAALADIIVEHGLRDIAERLPSIEDVLRLVDDVVDRTSNPA